MKKLIQQYNQFLFFKIPAAYFCGVRVSSISYKHCTSQVRFKWINQNPFKSIYFAVLAMAAELSTGALLLYYTKNSQHQFSTLVIGMKATFLKKAVGKISFNCNDGQSIKNHLNNAILSGNGEVFTLKSTGKNTNNETVAEFEFNWSIKKK